LAKALFPGVNGIKVMRPNSSA